MTTEKYSIPKKKPAYFDPLQEFVSQNQNPTGKTHTKVIFDRIGEIWNNFHLEHGKQRAVKTPEEKQQAKDAKFTKQKENDEYWTHLAKAQDVPTALRRAALEQAQAIQIRKQAEGKTKKRKRQDGDDEPPIASRKSLMEDDDEEEEEGEDEEVEEEVEEEEVEEEEVEEEEEEVEEEVEEKPKEQVAERQVRRQSIKKVLEKKLSVKALESLKTTFYSQIQDYGIGADESVAKVFEQMFEAALSQKKIVDSLETLIDDDLRE